MNRILMPGLCLLLLPLFEACSDADTVLAKHDGECVVLLHGLARSSLSMERMSWFLEENGYAVANIDYPSRDHKIEALAEMAVAGGLSECAEMNSVDKVHFVTHSLGGILVRYYFSENEYESLGRVVMLAPPNQGSKAVDEMQEWPGFEWLNGPAGYQLGKGEESIPLRLGAPEFEFAIVAGDATIDPVTSAVLDDPDDGRVSVADTRLDGMRDFRLVDASHAFIMQKSDVFELVRAFLANGRFPPETDPVDGR
ncbi:MAG: esterase/lipase family protein [Woeseiaceae bacterium]